MADIASSLWTRLDRKFAQTGKVVRVRWLASRRPSALPGRLAQVDRIECSDSASGKGGKGVRYKVPSGGSPSGIMSGLASLSRNRNECAEASILQSTGEGRGELLFILEDRNFPLRVLSWLLLNEEHVVEENVLLPGNSSLPPSFGKAVNTGANGERSR